MLQGWDADESQESVSSSFSSKEFGRSEIVGRFLKLGWYVCVWVGLDLCVRVCGCRKQWKDGVSTTYLLATNGKTTGETKVATWIRVFGHVCELPLLNCPFRIACIPPWWIQIGNCNSFQRTFARHQTTLRPTVNRAVVVSHISQLALDKEG